MGFSIKSSFDLRYLRHGSGEQVMTVAEGDTADSELTTLQEWPSSRGELSLRLLQGDTALIVENDLIGRFVIDREGALITVPAFAPVPIALREAFLWSTPFAVVGTDRDNVVVHAASVEVGGRGILFAGDTRVGKTTLASAFHAAGHRLLSDDGARCHVSSSSVYPGPALLRLRRDMADSVTSTDLELVHRTPDKVHFSVPYSRRGSGRSVPISAIVFLNWGEHSIERMNAESTIARLWPLAFYLPFERASAVAFESLAVLARSVAAYEVHRPRTESETSRVVDRLIEVCLS